MNCRYNSYLDLDYIQFYYIQFFAIFLSKTQTQCGKDMLYSYSLIFPADARDIHTLQACLCTRTTSEIVFPSSVWCALAKTGRHRWRSFGFTLWIAYVVWYEQENVQMNRIPECARFTARKHTCWSHSLTCIRNAQHTRIETTRIGGSNIPLYYCHYTTQVLRN